MVGDAQDWLEDIKDKAVNLKISAGHEADADLGPLISPEAKKRVESLIQSAVDEGAEVDIYSQNGSIFIFFFLQSVLFVVVFGWT